MQSRIPFICKKLYEKNLIAGLEGNISEKKGDKILITASQASKSNLQEKDLCLIELNQNSLRDLNPNHFKPNREAWRNPEQKGIKLKKTVKNKRGESEGSESIEKRAGSYSSTRLKQEEQSFDSQNDSSLRDHQEGQTQKPSSELEMHLAVYQTQEKAQAIIHAHPPSAIALSLARPQWKYLPPALPEMIVLMGRVPIVPYTRPGTKELGESLKGFVKKHQALILARHGAVVWAESLSQAFQLMEQLEQCCKVLILAESLGGAKTLSKKEIEKLTQN